jgi:hypothetical protein
MEEDFNLPPQAPQPFVVWLFRALGIRYTVFLPFIALLAFVLAGLALWRFKTPVLTAILVAVVPLPLFYGAMGMIDGMMASWSVVSLSGVSVKNSDLAEGAALSLVTMQVGLILLLPTYLLAVVGLTYRALMHVEAEVPAKFAEPRIGAVISNKV